jgi:hypothetical protein
VFFNADGSVTIAGEATLNGVAGYTFEVRAADRGEPGRNDTLALVVQDSAGTTVLNVAAPLAGGNLQSHRP